MSNMVMRLKKKRDAEARLRNTTPPVVFVDNGSSQYLDSVPYHIHDSRYYTESEINTIVSGLETDISDLFQSVSDGKTALVTDIETKGGTVSQAGSVATFDELSDGILSIPTGGSSEVGAGLLTMDSSSMGLTIATPTMTSNTAPSGVASASAEYNSTYAAWKAFDKSVSSSWMSYTLVDSAHWLAYEFSTAKTIKAYAVNSSTYYATTWKLQGWNGSSWVDLDSRTGQLNVPAYYKISSTGSYTKYRLYITGTSYTGNARVVINELFLYE